MLGTAISSTILGITLEGSLFRRLFPALFEPSSVGGLPKAIGVTLGALAVSGFWLTTYGFKVGFARSKYKELAKKDGENNVDERYSLPNLYVEGQTPHAKAFNW